LIISALIGLALTQVPDMPSWSIFVFAFAFFSSILIYLIILDYVYNDAKSRGMNPWLWIIIVIVVPYLLGFVIYLLLRSPFTKEVCPQCSYVLNGSYAFCPQCGNKIKTNCPQCKKIIDTNQNFCPFCGFELKERTQN
jgi:RNA polymerase subunit RPABC4/transcription elongation factor Spt4